MFTFHEILRSAHGNAAGAAGRHPLTGAAPIIAGYAGPAPGDAAGKGGAYFTAESAESAEFFSLGSIFPNTLCVLGALGVEKTWRYRFAT